MAIIYSAISILFLVSTISATVGALPPRDVYSAVIHNEQDSPIECYVVWSPPSGSLFQSNLVTIASQGTHSFGEQSVPTSTWVSHAVITEVHAGDLVLKAPFDGVNSPKKDWNFCVFYDKIVSGSQCSNAIKY